MKITTDGSNARKGDVNEDGTVDVADIASVISIMAKGARLQQQTGTDEQENNTHRNCPQQPFTPPFTDAKDGKKQEKGKRGER